MNNHVHYLIRDPTNKNGLIYPVELDDKHYYGCGAFYLLGQLDTKINENYLFHAIRGEQIVQAELMLVEGSRVDFRAEVQGIGVFHFNAQPLVSMTPYAGNVASAANLFAIRLLSSLNPEELDQACREHDFYFVGFSPRVE